MAATLPPATPELMVVNVCIAPPSTVKKRVPLTVTSWGKEFPTLWKTKKGEPPLGTVVTA